MTLSRIINMIKAGVLAFAVATCGSPSNAETPDEWIALGARVHGAFGAFIPVGIKIGLDAVKRLNAKPRELTVLYYDSDSSPCACFADDRESLTADPKTLRDGRWSLAVGAAGACEKCWECWARRPGGGCGCRVTAPIGSIMIPASVLMAVSVYDRASDAMCPRFFGIFRSSCFVSIRYNPHRLPASPIPEGS